MAAPMKNEFWKFRSKHGRDRLFETADLLWEEACKYFQWTIDNPLYETKGFAFQGFITKEEFPLMRAMTLDGLCFYLNCSRSWWHLFKGNLVPGFDDDFILVMEAIEKVVYRQKFEGAAAGLLNTNIIARDLGLTDKTETKIEGGINIHIDQDDAKL